MRYGSNLAVGLVAVVSMISSGSSAQTPAAPPQTQEVQLLANKWTEAYNQKNVGALASLYAQDARLFLHGSPTVSGRSNIERYWADDMKVNNPLTVLTVTDAVNGIDMKLVHGNYQVLNRNTGVPLGHGRFAHIWMRDGNGEWHLDRDLWNQPVED